MRTKDEMLEHMGNRIAELESLAERYRKALQEIAESGPYPNWCHCLEDCSCGHVEAVRIAKTALAEKKGNPRA